MEISPAKVSVSAQWEAGSQGGPSLYSRFGRWLVIEKSPFLHSVQHCVYYSVRCHILVFGSAHFPSEQLVQELRELLTNVLGQ